jgi:alpha-glucosidase
MSKIEHEPLTPKWWRSAVVYQIYPLSFKDTTGNGRGDLKGIIENLDYLNGTDESLGIDAIWINPIYPSPKKDHGYDVIDYCDIDSEFGDLKTFDLLIQEAEKRGIKIIMDYVLNHTSSQNPWFIESRSSRDNPKADWYIWRDPKPDGSAPNNWLSVFGGPAWTYDEGRGQYYMHSFLSDQPDLNWRNPEVVEAMKNVFQFWLDRGVHGFRADAIEHLFKDDLFRDEPENPNHNHDTDNPYNALFHTHSRNQRGKILETMKEFDELLGKDFQNFMVSETWLNAEDLLEYHQASQEGLCLPLNLNLLHMPWHVNDFKSFIDRYDSLLGKAIGPIMY